MKKDTCNRIVPWNVTVSCLRMILLKKLVSQDQQWNVQKQGSQLFHWPDAEKGDAVFELAEATGETYKDIAETELNVPYQTVKNWVWKANRISPKLGECLSSQTLTDFHIQNLLKYPHNIQDLLAMFIVDWNEKNPDNKITS